MTEQEAAFRQQPTAGRPPRKRSGVGGLELMISAAEVLIEKQQWFHVPVLAENIGKLLMNRRDHGRAMEWFQKALDALPRCGIPMPSPTRGMLLHQIGMSALISGRKIEARTSFEQSLPLLRTEGARREYAISLGNLGPLLAEGNQKELALKHLHEAVTITSTLGDDGLYGQGMGNLGLFLFHQKRPEEALPYLRASLDPLRRCNDAQTLGLVLQALDALRAIDLVDPEGQQEQEPPRFVN